MQCNHSLSVSKYAIQKSKQGMKRRRKKKEENKWTMPIYVFGDLNTLLSIEQV